VKAVLCTEYGAPEELRVQEVPDPEISADQVLVRVHAAGVNFVDALLVAGLYQVKIPPPFIPGGDLSGTVIAVGDSVRDFEPGDRVLASPGIGAYAEKIALHRSQLAHMPGNMDFEAAAVFLQAHMTAYFALKTRGRITEGETVLVLGAGGGTGTAAIQVARALGARVIAAASSAEKLAACRELGADVLVDYGAQDLRAELKAATGGRGVDLVFDPIGGSHAQTALRSCAENGRYLVVGFASGEIPAFPANLPLLKSCQIVGVDLGGYTGRHPETGREVMRAVLEMRLEGRIKDPPIMRFAFDDTGKALAALAGRTVTGKCVIEIAT
jgi:NADPH2:quinone reductase